MRLFARLQAGKKLGTRLDWEGSILFREAWQMSSRFGLHFQVTTMLGMVTTHPGKNVDVDIQARMISEVVNSLV